MSSAQLKKFALVKPAEIEWRDGLPFSLEFDDVYFSIHGAVEESTHVFIEGNQLSSDWKAHPEKDFTITELGFGSGLNFLNTVSHWLKHLSKKKQGSNNDNSNKTSSQHLNYVAIEKRPFNKNDLVRVHKLWPQFEKISQQLILNYPSQSYGRHQITFKEWNVTLTLMWMPLDDAFNDLILESVAQENKTVIDHWFLDGFAPQKNASMWDEKNARKIAVLSCVGTRIATYSVAAGVKKPLVEAGFEIVKRTGFAKKREMLTAIFQNDRPLLSKTKTINIKHETPWFHINKIEKNENSKVAIIGAGIAGCATAYCLGNKGFACDIYESNSEIASGASGAAAGIFHPQISSDMNFSSQFSWLSYLALLRFLSSLTIEDRSKIIISKGLHRFLENRSSKQKVLKLSKELNLSYWIKENDASTNTTFIKSERNIYFPHSAVIDMPALCQLYLNKIEKLTPNVYTNTMVNSLVSDGNDWQVSSNQGQKKYQHVVFCGGAKSHLLDDLFIADTNTTRGQTCQFQSENLSKVIKTTISEQVYLVPKLDKSNHQFLLGATFDNEQSTIFNDHQLNNECQKEILNRCSKLLKDLSIPCLSDSGSNKSQMDNFPLNGSVGYRLHANDRFPMVGAVIDQQKLKDTFSDYGQKRILRQSVSTYNQAGLWMNTAYGSHGLLHSLLASQHLTSLVNQTISPLEYKLTNKLHSARFLIKQLNTLPLF